MKKIILIIMVSLLILILCYNKGYWVLKAKITPQISARQYTGIITYLINLDRSKDRLDYMMPKIHKLGLPFQRIQAVNGNMLTGQELKEKLDLNKYLNYLGHIPKNGTIGCSLSHMKSWEKFLESNYEYALILEDDVDFDPIILTQTIQELIKNKDLWDITSFNILHNGTPLILKQLSNNNLVIYLTNVTYAGAYIISRQAAAKLITKALPIVLPVDHYFTRGWELDLKFTGIEPRLVYQKHGSSEINQSSLIENSGASFLIILSKILFKTQTSVIKFFYNIKIWWQLHQT